MLSGIQIEFLSKLNEMLEIALSGDESFPDELCNFISTAYQLEACALFSVANHNRFTVVGKSSGTKKNYIIGNSFTCSKCNLHNETSNYMQNYNSECQLLISEFLVYEMCSNVNISGDLKFLFKLAKKTSFSKIDQDAVEKVLRLVTPYLIVWLNAQGKEIKINKDSFSNIFSEFSSHLRSNANSIMGITSILSEGNNLNSSLEYLGSIKKNAQNILLNISDLAELTKAESNSLVLNKKKISVAKFITETVNLFKSKLVDKTINFNVEIDDFLHKPIDIDEQKLRYILINLLYVLTTLSANGNIFVKGNSANKGKINIITFDNEVSLSQEILNNFFEPFAVTKLEEFRNSSLTGLSLPLVKKYANFIGGDITISGGANKGISFTLTFNGEVMSSLESTLSQLPKPTSKNKVLVIEDDYATSKLLSNYLNKWGYDPTIVSTEQQAFSIIENEHLLAVILDIEIPNTNGLELLKKIHEHPNTKNVPVIVCSIEPEQQKAFMMGAVEYFIKPINYNYLVEVLTSYKLRKDSNVLCVDDDLPTLNLVKKAIDSAGFNAIAENVSANVMELIKDKSIDLAIVDLDMPTPNGFELIKLIKSEKKFANLPIIIYTGKENYREDLHKVEGLFEELLDKRATNIEDLADTINAMINRYEIPPPQEEVIAKKGGKKILLAEDYKHSQIIVTRLLKKNGFEDIIVVENGEDAVKMAQQEKFELILMDMQMPIMNGFEATEKIRQFQDYKNIPIIALTAFAMKGDREKCLEAGATDYIPKPIDSKEFIDKVKYYTNAL